MSEMRREKGNGKIRTIVTVFTLIMLGLLAWFVIKAEKEAETDKKYTFETNSEIVSFINTFGFIVEPDPETEKITIPAEFNDSYNEYNELQKSQGFDLMPYAGKEAVLYTYKVLNFPDYPENVVINLLFDDHRLIAADITYQDAENGFTKALIDNCSVQTSANTETSSETTAPEETETEETSSEATSLTVTEAPAETETTAATIPPESTETSEMTATAE